MHDCMSTVCVRVQHLYSCTCAWKCLLAEQLPLHRLPDRKGLTEDQLYRGRVVSKSRFRLKTSSTRADRSSLRFQIVSYPWFTCRRRGRFCRGQPPRRRDDATTPFNEPSLQTRGANRKRVMNAIAKKNAASLPSRI